MQSGQKFPSCAFGAHGASGAFGARGLLRAAPLATNCWPRGGGGVGVQGPAEPQPPRPPPPPMGSGSQGRKCQLGPLARAFLTSSQITWRQCTSMIPKVSHESRACGVKQPPVHGGVCGAVVRTIRFFQVGRRAPPVHWRVLVGPVEGWPEHGQHRDVRGAEHRVDGRAVVLPEMCGELPVGRCTGDLLVLLGGPREREARGRGGGNSIRRRTLLWFEGLHGMGTGMEWNVPTEQGESALHAGVAAGTRRHVKSEDCAGNRDSGSQRVGW